MLNCITVPDDYTEIFLNLEWETIHLSCTSGILLPVNERKNRTTYILIMKILNGKPIPVEQ